MSYLILYFSGTGNTELIAREITTRLEKTGKSVELLSIESKEQIHALDFTSKIIGFGYPIYKFSFPDIFKPIIKQVNQLAKNNMYFQFSTYTRFQSNSFADFSRALNQDAFHLIAERAFKAPSCGISARKDPNDYEYQSVMFFEDNIDQSIDSFLQDILAENLKTKHMRPYFTLDHLKKHIVKDIEITKYPYLSIREDLCISCCLCANNCPQQNLIFDSSSKQIQILDHVNCLHCLRCMHHCPVNAITFGTLTEGDNQYTLATRNELFNKATSGHQEQYWKIFNKVIRQWRTRTILYWIKQKFKK